MWGKNYACQTRVSFSHTCDRITTNFSTAVRITVFSPFNMTGFCQCLTESNTPVLTLNMELAHGLLMDRLLNLVRRVKDGVGCSLTKVSFLDQIQLIHQKVEPVYK